LSAAIVIAGCQSSSKTSAMNVDCIPQSTHARQLRSFGAALGNLQRTSKASPPARATINTSSSHAGQAESRTNRPLVNTGLEYLKKN
jgi:hypothetical protein